MTRHDRGNRLLHLLCALAVAAACGSVLVPDASAGAVRPAPGSAPGTPTPGVIHGVRILSDQVEDLSSMESIRAHIERLTPGEPRVDELFRLAVKFRHQISPPQEFLGSDNHAHDPIKIFNVYGYSKCCCYAAMMLALWREAGLEARGWSLTHHSISEVFFGQRWHMYDLSLINYFVTDAGYVAGVEDLIDQRERLINRNHSRFIDKNGYFPALAHRLETRLSGGVYDVDKSWVYEYPYTLGHTIGLTLRANESVTRNWSNKKLHIGSGLPLEWPLPMDVTGAVGSQVYLKEYYPDYRMGLIGNGELNYSPDLASGAYRGGILSEENIASSKDDGLEPAIHLVRPGAGQIVFPFRSSYVFLTGRIHGRFVADGPAGGIRAFISLNNGLDWKEVWSSGPGGSGDVDVDLSPFILRRYQYLIKFELRDPASRRTGFDSLAFTHDIQHAQRPLPLLRRGTNRITVSAPEPALTTRTIEAALKKDNARNAAYGEFHPRIDNLTGDGLLFLAGGTSGTLTFPVRTPGPIRAVRFGGSFRARAKGTGVRLLVSDDAGATWKEAASLRGPFVGLTRYVAFDRIAPDTRDVLVRYQFDGPGEVGLFVFRIDVDYTDQGAGARPIRVTYAWEEQGTARSHSQVVRRYPTSYTIVAESDPLMKSIRVEGL